MNRIRYGVGMSVDGRLADPDGRTDFLVADATYDPGPFFASIDSVVMGRVTYLEAVRQGMRAYAGLRNYVVSTTLPAEDFPEVTILRDAGAVDAVRQSADRDVWLCGGGVLLASLLALGLVDTIELGVSPRLLGRGGTPMIGIDARLPVAVPLQLTQHRALPSGLVILDYDVVGPTRRARPGRAAR
jgi:dihydrofolate reductase